MSVVIIILLNNSVNLSTADATNMAELDFNLQIAHTALLLMLEIFRKFCGAGRGLYRSGLFINAFMLMVYTAKLFRCDCANCQHC